MFMRIYERRKETLGTLRLISYGGHPEGVSFLKYSGHTCCPIPSRGVSIAEYVSVGLGRSFSFPNLFSTYELGIYNNYHFLNILTFSLISMVSSLSDARMQLLAISAASKNDTFQISHKF